MANTVAMNKPTLSDILRELIREKGLSVSELARRIHLPQPTIQRMTSGAHTRPHKKTLTAIAEYFDVSIDQLCGIEPIPWLIKSTLVLKKIPILNQEQVPNWPQVSTETLQHIVVDRKIGDRSYAIEMPDASMDPLIPKGSLLIIDPDKMPHYRSFVIVKLKDYPEVIVRQLIKDAKNCYIKPLSLDFDQPKIMLLGADDLILGTVVEVRLHCEDY